jgi:hypothetical protein
MTERGSLCGFSLQRIFKNRILLDGTRPQRPKVMSRSDLGNAFTLGRIMVFDVKR